MSIKESGWLLLIGEKSSIELKENFLFFSLSTLKYINHLSEKQMAKRIQYMIFVLFLKKIVSEIVKIVFQSFKWKKYRFMAAKKSGIFSISAVLV